MNEDTPELTHRRSQLRAEIRRNQASAYNGLFMVGTGAMFACLAFIHLTVTTVVGIGAAAIFVPLGVLRIVRSFRSISRSHAELESIERKPLPAARIVE